MKIRRFLPYGIIILVVLGLSAGCSRGPSEQELKLAQLQEQVVTITQQYEVLQQARLDITGAEEALAEIEAIAERRRTEEQKAQAAEIPATIEGLTATRDEAFDSVQSELATFLTVALNEFPEEPMTLEALKIYAAEVIELANETVAKSGDYKKAGDQLDSANSYFTDIGLDPYPPLIEEIAVLDEMRFITQERFDQVAKNMTKDEVAAIAGVVYYQNIQEDTKNGVETWLYRKREGGAAAIYFRTKTGKVYNKNFDAVKTKVVTD